MERGGKNGRSMFMDIETMIVEKFTVVKNHTFNNVFYGYMSLIGKIGGIRVVRKVQTRTSRLPELQRFAGIDLKCDNS